MTLQESIKRIKGLFNGFREHDPEFCILCPPSCKEDGDKHWYCPLIKGEICETCCHFDMDGQDWPRDIDENCCCGCEHYNPIDWSSLKQLKLEDIIKESKND